MTTTLLTQTIFATSTGSTGIGGIGFIIYLAFFGVLIYFMAYRPQKKEKQKMQQLLASVAVGDTVLTVSGFYGVIIDMSEDTVIVEFGNNKNCRIPMQKTAIVQVEKPEGSSSEPDKTEKTEKTK